MCSNEAMLDVININIKSHDFALSVDRKDFCIRCTWHGHIDFRIAAITQDEAVEAAGGILENAPNLASIIDSYRHSKSRLGHIEVCIGSGFRDYAELLVAMGDADLPLPALSKSEIDEQVKIFTEIWEKD